MIQELKEVKKDESVSVNFGDMFRWTEKARHSRGKKFIYLGHEKCYEIPFTLTEGSERTKNWDGLSFNEIVGYLKEGDLIKLPKGSTFTVTQE